MDFSGGTKVWRLEGHREDQEPDTVLILPINREQERPIVRALREPMPIPLTALLPDMEEDLQVQKNRKNKIAGEGRARFRGCYGWHL